METTQVAKSELQYERFYVVQTFEIKGRSLKKCSSCQRWAFWHHHCHSNGVTISRYACSDHQNKKFYQVEKDLFEYLVKARKVE